MLNRPLKTDGKGLLFSSNSPEDDTVSDSDGVAFCAVQTPTKDTALGGTVAFPQNLRATTFKLESLVGWIAAMVALVVAVQVFG